MEVLEFVHSRPGFYPDSVGFLPVGSEFSLFRVFLVPSEDEVADFEFSFYNFLAMTNDYFLFLRCSRKAASLLTSSINSSSSRRLTTLVGKSVSVSVRQESLVSSMGMTASVP